MLPLYEDAQSPSTRTSGFGKTFTQPKRKVTHFVAVQKDITFLIQRKSQIIKWDDHEVFIWLSNFNLSQYAKVFKKHQIRGVQLLDPNINEEYLENVMQIISERDRKLIYHKLIQIRDEADAGTENNESSK